MRIDRLFSPSLERPKIENGPTNLIPTKLTSNSVRCTFCLNWIMNSIHVVHLDSPLIDFDWKVAWKNLVLKTILVLEPEGAHAKVG